MINILHLSDIHWGKNSKPEDEGIVMDTFYHDLPNVLSKEDKDNNYCIISGDLVDKGGSDHIYAEFYTTFLSKILTYVPLGHIVVTAGNHDLNRKWVEDNIDAHKEDIYKQRTESEFNDYVNGDDCNLFNKFAPFDKFCKETLSIPEYNISSYYRNITSELSVFMLNSSLCSSGGFDRIEDIGHMRIDTRVLCDWINQNHGRTKVVVMHHPISHLDYESQQKLNALCRSGIDFLLAGHEHAQNMFQMEQNGAYVILSPQLYSSYDDLNGYSVIHFNGEAIVDISYRQWSKRHHKFLPGQDYTGTDNGVWYNIGAQKAVVIDTIEEKLQDSLDEAMTSLGVKPKWADRKLSTRALNVRHEDFERDLDYIDILNASGSFQITAPAQFGLSCFAHYMALKAWTLLKKHWIYVDAKNWSLSQVERSISSACSKFKITISEADCILIDNWRNSYKDLDKIVSKLNTLCNDKRIIYLTHGSDPVISALQKDENRKEVSMLYLKVLSRKDLRVFVNCMDSEHTIADEDEVVERLNQDVISLNMHRTPHNTIQLMTAYSENFAKRPVNRTKVLDSVLRSIFENPDGLFYSDKIDDVNCKVFMALFTKHLVKNKRLDFTQSEFRKICEPYAEENYNSTNLDDLITYLKAYQIIIEVDGRLQFRQLYWVSYFVAYQMTGDPEFASQILDEEKGIFNADLMDFYTGLDSKNDEIAEKVISKLAELRESVFNRVGIDEEFNPFKDIKWRLNESKAGITQEKLEQQVKESRMPDDIKEAVADSAFDSVKPYTQQISKFFDDYDVKNLMDLLTSASRMLRNSEFISAKNKKDLSAGILQGWEVLMRVLFCISPLMAKTGFGGMGGANFKLTDNFPKDYAECLKHIIISMPFNIINWYMNDFYSDKLIPLLKKEYLYSSDNELIRHLVALIVCDARPKEFDSILAPYIGSVGKNTFYLGNLYTNLRYNYQYRFMKTYELEQTANLIKACFVKHNTGALMPGKDKINQFDRLNGKLPSRKDFED